MSFPSLTVTIRGGSDGLPTLNLTPANGYYMELDGLGLGTGEVWAREYAESRFVSGSALISAKREHQSGFLIVYVTGGSVTELWSRINTLKAAVRQFSYKIDVSIGAVSETYNCDPADSTVGKDSGVISPFELAGNEPGLSVTLTIPHKP